MARVKITEHRAKTILFQELKLSYKGISINSKKVPQLQKNKRFVLKVDEGIKKRMKKGLVILDVNNANVKTKIRSLQQKGYSRFIIEPLIPHDASSEKFLSCERTREGIIIYYSNKGGIDIEDNTSDLKKDILTEKNIISIARHLSIPEKILLGIKHMFDLYYVSFLEINPLVVTNSQIYILDLALEVDNTALFFVKNIWHDEDIVTGEIRKKTPEELAVKDLSSKTPAALSLEVLNPNGSIFLLLSGGGVSVTLADEIYNLGYGKEIANYGEYSGNPNQEETYLYTKEILSLLSKSKSKKKVLIIGGGVANFTDVRVTFKGILQAFEEKKQLLKKLKVKIYVRRGGPYQEEGLSMMKQFLIKEKLYGIVSGPDMPLNEIVRLGIDYIKKS